MRWPVAIILTLLCDVLRAQLVAPQLKTITTHDGLSSDHVMAIEVDPLGYLWIGTGDGLNRFSGKDVKVIRAHSGPNELPGDKITAICSDGVRYLYIGTNAAFLTILDAIEDTIANVALPVPAYSMHGEQRVNDVHIDHQGRIWVAHGARCLSRFDAKAMRFATLEVVPPLPTPPEREVVLSIHEDGTGILWLSTFRGLVRFDPEDGTLQPVPIHPASGTPGDRYAYQVRGVVDDDSCLVFGTWSEGIFRMRKRDGQVRLLWPEASHKPTFTDHAVQDMLRHEDGKVLAATVDMGLLLLDLRTGKVSHYDRRLDEQDCRKQEDLLVGAARLMRHGEILVIGTYSQGVALWSERANTITGVHLPGHPAGEMDDGILDVQRDPITGATNALAHRHGLFVYDAELRLRGRIEQDAGVELRRYLSLLRLSGDDYLVGGMPHWAAMDVRTMTGSLPRFSMGATPCDKGIWWARGDRQQGLWCNTGNFELFHIDTVALTCSPLSAYAPQVDTLLRTWPVDVFVDDAGRTWFLSYNSPPVVLHADGRAHVLQGPASMAPFTVSDIAQTPDGRIWLAAKHTGLGLVNVNATGELSVTDESVALHSRNIVGLAAMTDGSLWTALPQALQYFNPETGECKVLTVADGLPSTTYTLSDMHEPQAPPLIVGAVEGFFTVKESALDGASPPTLQLVEVYANDSLVRRHAHRSSDEELILSYEQDRLMILIRSTNLIDPIRDEYAYRLLGSDTAWVIIPSDDRISFNGLRHGSYRFEVKGRTSGGPWGEVAAMIVRITPPFWSTWWFRLLVALALGSIGWLAFRFVLRRRLRKQREQMERERAVLEERIRIAHDLHDDLGSGLASIGMESELAAMESGDAATRDALKRVSEGARSVGDDMRRIIWAMGSGQETVGDLIAYVRGFAGEMLDQAGIDLVFHQELTDPSRKLSMEQRKHVALFCKEAVHNVVKHAAATRVVMRMVQNDLELRLHVDDDGRGFGPDAPQGTGTTSMRDRAAALHGTLVVDSHPGKGTRISLTLQL